MVRIERHRLQDPALDRLEKLRIWMRSEGFGGVSCSFCLRTRGS